MPVFGAGSGDTLLAGLGTFWDKSFADHELLVSVYRAAEMSLSQMYLDMLGSMLKLSVDDIPVFDRRLWSFLDLNEADFAVNADGLYEIDLPDDVVSFKYLYNRAVSPTVIYERGYDFTIDETARTIAFNSNIYSPVANGLPSYTDANGDVHIGLWAPDARVDTDALYEHLGTLFNKRAVSSQAYKDLLKGVWRFFVLGPTLEYIESAMNVMAGLPVSNYDSDVITAINNPGNLGVEVVTANATYVFPYTTVLKSNVIVGYSLSLYEPMTTAFTVTDYVEDDTWWSDAIIPYVMAPDMPLARRRARDAYYAPIYGGPDETITAFSNVAETDWYDMFAVVPGDYLWLGASGSEESYLITEVDGAMLQFTPPYPTDVNEDLRFSIGSLSNMTARAGVKLDGYTMRVGGMYYGDLDFTYGTLRLRHLPYELWRQLLKYHVFAVVYDQAAMPADVDVGYMIETLKRGKPGYTLPYVQSLTAMDDTVNPAETWNIAVAVDIDDTVAWGDNELKYGGSASYGDPIVYYGGKDLAYQKSAIGTPATAPSDVESIYIGQPAITWTNQYTIDANITYTLADGVLADLGIFEGWTLGNSASVDAFSDVSGSHVNFDHGAATTAFASGTYTGPEVFLLTGDPTVFTCKFDISDLDAVTGSALIISMRSEADYSEWAGIRLSFNGLNECILEGLDTGGGSTGVDSTTNLGTGITEIWVKLIRDVNAYDDVGLEYRIGDVGAFTAISTVTKIAMDLETEVSIALTSSAGTAFDVDLLDMELSVQVS